jgi:hypothetical protein
MKWYYYLLDIGAVLWLICQIPVWFITAAFADAPGTTETQAIVNASLFVIFLALPSIAWLSYSIWKSKHPQRPLNKTARLLLTLLGSAPLLVLIFYISVGFVWF